MPRISAARVGCCPAPTTAPTVVYIHIYIIYTDIEYRIYIVYIYVKYTERKQRQRAIKPLIPGQTDTLNPKP